MLKNKRILIVDDSRLTSRITAEFLNENGYETETVQSGEEAVQICCGSFPPDLILMDIELADEMDGIDAADIINKYKEIPVIFYTANISKEIINRAKEVKAYGFVLKGMDKIAILSTVEMALRLHEANTSAKMFDRFFENSVNEMYIFNKKSLKFIAVNHAARKSLGYTGEELSSMTPFDINPELDLEGFQGLLEQFKNNEKEQIFFNTMHKRKDKSQYPVKVDLQLLNYGDEELLFAMAIDLTEGRAMKEELEEKESMLDAIISSARDAIVMLDGKRCVTLWNPAAEQLFGYSREEMPGKDIYRLLAPDEEVYQKYSRDSKFIGQALAEKPVEKTVERKAMHRDGTELDLEISISYVKRMEELNTVGILRDIRERKHAGEALERSHKQYLELAENAPIGIIKCDQRGNIVYVNKKVVEIVGSPGSEETKKINLLTFPRLVEYGIASKLEECLQTNMQSVLEMEYESIWGKRIWMRLHMKPLTDRNRVTGAQIIIDDITEKKHLEEELHNLSITDYLTNIYNRRFFIQKLEEEIERAQRNTSSSFSLVMLDIDHFKSINDRFGHSTGDQVLKGLADTLKSRIRKIDFLARLGGEEFVILLVDTPVEKAAVLVEELRLRVSNMAIPGVDRVTASFGVTGYCPGDTSDTIVQRADKMMYQAKDAGRNCVCCSRQDK